jgi:hypothetical protein
MNPKKKRKPKTGLLQIGRDFKPIVRDSSTSKDGTRKYWRVRRVTLPRGKVEISRERFEQVVNGLKLLYPDKGYEFGEAKIGRRQCWSITRKEEKGQGIPFYYSPRSGRFYMHSRHVRNNPKLASMITVYRLKSLGVAYHLKMVGEKKV